MGETEFKVFLVLTSLILFIFIGGILAFIFQYHKKKLAYDREKEIMNEEHARELLNATVEMQQQTMQDISREIHDNIGQKLTLAELYANTLVYDNQYPQFNEKISSIGVIINESLVELRMLSRALMSAGSESADLEELLQKECSRINAAGKQKVSCTFNKPGVRIPGDIRNFILRIVQEFMQNSMKHANCKNITLAFEYRENGLYIHTSDDGKGFDMNSTEPRKGIGLTNMKKRAELMGAQFS